MNNAWISEDVRGFSEIYDNQISIYEAIKESSK
jgi:hypothetical protein